MKSPSKRRTSDKERELTERIRELEEKLAASVPKAKFEAVKSNLQLEINDLKLRLSVAEDQASRGELPKPAVEGRLDEDGFEEREAEGPTAEINQMASSTKNLATGDPKESETADPEDEESEEPETAESCMESQITDESYPFHHGSRGTKVTVSET
jgi:hypothetical protein